MLLQTYQGTWGQERGRGRGGVSFIESWVILAVSVAASCLIPVPFVVWIGGSEGVLAHKFFRRFALEGISIPRNSYSIPSGSEYFFFMPLYDLSSRNSIDHFPSDVTSCYCLFTN